MARKPTESSNRSKRHSALAGILTRNPDEVLLGQVEARFPNLLEDARRGREWCAQAGSHGLVKERRNKVWVLALCRYMRGKPPRPEALAKHVHRKLPQVKRARAAGEKTPRGYSLASVKADLRALRQHPDFDLHRNSRPQPGTRKKPVRTPPNRSRAP